MKVLAKILLILAGPAGVAGLIVGSRALAVGALCLVAAALVLAAASREGGGS